MSHRWNSSEILMVYVSLWKLVNLEWSWEKSETMFFQDLKVRRIKRTIIDESRRSNHFTVRDPSINPKTVQVQGPSSSTKDRLLWILFIFIIQVMMHLKQADEKSFQMFFQWAIKVSYRVIYWEWTSVDGVISSADWATVIDGEVKIFLHNRSSDKSVKTPDLLALSLP